MQKKQFRQIKLMRATIINISSKIILLLTKHSCAFPEDTKINQTNDRNLETAVGIAR
jgi:hypothetical protein